MKLSLNFLQKILEGIATTREVEIGCDDCFEELDQFAEMQLQGKNASEAMPLIQDHLNRCKACYEEYQALLEAIQLYHDDNAI